MNLDRTKRGIHPSAPPDGRVRASCAPVTRDLLPPESGRLRFKGDAPRGRDPAWEAGFLALRLSGAPRTRTWSRRFWRPVPYPIWPVPLRTDSRRTPAAYNRSGPADVAELADAPRLGRGGLRPLGVRVPPSALRSSGSPRRNPGWSTRPALADAEHRARGRHRTHRPRSHKKPRSQLRTPFARVVK
jgi:hypothetical protein